jgi:transposase
MPVVLGPALSMKAIPGGKATHDTIDAHKIAALRRGGMLPQASVYPAQRRATRDVLRRRPPLMRNRAALLSHVQHTHAQSNRSEIGKNIAYQANRPGIAERVADPAVQQTMEVDLSLIPSDDELLQDRARSLLTTAKHHDAQPLYLLHTVPGSGKILRLVWRYDMHRLDRFPRVQDVASSGRLVNCRQEAGGTRVGTSGQNIGKAHLTGAFSDAATLCWRHTPQGQKRLARLENKPDTGTALSLLAHQLGRAVYCMLKRQVAVAREMCLQPSESSAGEPGASLDSTGMRLKRVRSMSD